MMKTFVGLTTLIAGAAAFPSAAPLVERSSIVERQVPGVGLSKTFNAKRQLVNVHGLNKFVPPDFENGDQRGPCPGLNALANHGYLPHNGIGTIAQFTFATNQVYGLAYDIAGGFGLYGALTAGDGLQWSIGGPPEGGIAQPNLLGRPLGISFTHNTYEGDSSATREDFYTSGKDYVLDMRYFKELYNILPTSSYTTLAKHRDTRVHNSIATNPYYFNGPFTGVAVAGGANAFVFRLASNHSKEFPQGYLDKDVFASFWSVTGKGENLKWTPGWDRIPENWYRRPHDDEYDIPFIGKDLAENIVLHPNSAMVGGNTGKTNSFVGVDITNLTYGVFGAEDLAKGNNAACFAFQAGTLLAPNILSTVFSDVTGPLDKLEKTFGKMLAPLNCPQLKKLNEKYLDQFPGYKKPHRHASSGPV